MTKTLTSASALELQAQLETIRQTSRGDMGEALVEAIKKIDKIAAEVWRPADIPTDVQAIRQTLVASVQNFNMISDRAIEIPSDPAAPPASPVSQPIGAFPTPS